MPAARQARQTDAPQSPGRAKMIAAVHIEWKKLRPDLHLDDESLRAERLVFVQDALKLKKPVSSLRVLSNAQLGRVLDAMRRLRAQPRLGGYAPPLKPEIAPATGAEIFHLASAEQVFTISKLFDYLDWTLEFQKRFISRRFKREKPALLSPSNAHALIRILINIACSRDIKERGVGRVSRAMIAAEIPALKARLQIDRPRAAEEVRDAKN
jgi:hypothetical protein